jgi:hypothetical protein
MKFHPAMMSKNEGNFVPNIPADKLVAACRAAATLLPFEGDVLEENINGYDCFCDHHSCGYNIDNTWWVRFYPVVEGYDWPLIIEI